jgi:hypothetical protein
MIRNVHERRLQATAAEVAPLLRTLASDDDRLWPRDRWPAMELSHGVNEGSSGGHGFVRYSVETVTPDSVTFRFDNSIGLRGEHRFEVEDTSDGGCVLRHVLEGKSTGWMKLGWPLVVRPLHNALVEDGLDNANGFVSGVQAEQRPLTMHVELLRRCVSMLMQPADPPAPEKRIAGDVVASALVGLAALHALWGAEATTWPGTDTASLAETVVGSSTFPSASACYVVAALLGAAGGLLAAHSRVTQPKAFTLTHLGTKTVGSVLLLRGVGGLVVSAFGLVNVTAVFRRNDLVLYSPLCLALGMATLWSSQRSRTSARLRTPASHTPHTNASAGKTAPASSR